MENRKTARDISVAVSVAFVVRLGYLVILRRAIDMPDSIHYINMAKQFAAGDLLGFDDNLPVLYSAFAAVVHVVIRDWEVAFWTVSLIASSLLVVPVYLLAEVLFGRSTARIVATLVCFWPWLVDYGSRVAPEALAVTLFFSSVYLLYRGIVRGGLPLYLAPLSFFLLHLTRPEGTFHMIAAPVAGAVLCYRAERERWRRLAGFTAAVVLLTGAYALFMRTAIGTATVSYRAPMSGDLLDYLRRGLIDFGRTFMRLSFDLLPVMLGPLLLVFLGVGLFRSTDRPRRWRLETLLLIFCGVQWGLTLLNVSPAPRYIMTVVITLSIWSARGIELVSLQAGEVRSGRWLRFVPLGAAMAAILLGLASDLASESMGRMPRTPREYRIVGRWMGENLEPGLIVSRKPQVGFYADMPSIGPEASANPESVVAFAEKIGARYLVVDERYSVGIVPGLRGLLNPAVVSEDLELIRGDLSPYEGARVAVYQFVPEGIEYVSAGDVAVPTSHMGPDERRRKKSSADE